MKEDEPWLWPPAAGLLQAYEGGEVSRAPGISHVL